MEWDGAGGSFYKFEWWCGGAWVVLLGGRPSLVDVRSCVGVVVGFSLALFVLAVRNAHMAQQLNSS